VETLEWQTVVYEARLAAAASADEIIGAAWLCALDVEHPVRRFVAAMAAYAQDIARGEQPGPYSDASAEFHARLRLIPEGDLAVCWHAPDPWLAARYGVPLTQIAARRVDLLRAGQALPPGMS
jgi:hypothetical protein